MFVYIIECEDGSLYTGIANDIVSRLREHYYRLKLGAKYTKSHQMQSLRCLWQVDDKSMACKLEYRIKRLSKSEKLDLIEQPINLERLFADKLECGNCHFVPQNIQNDYFEQVLELRKSNSVESSLS